MRIKCNSVFIIGLIVILGIASPVFSAALNLSSQKNIAKTSQNKPVPVTQPMAGETITWQVVSSGGAIGNSTSYNLQGTVGQTATGSGTSTSYGVNSGYWQEFESGGGCCVGVRGDVNCSGGDPDISDITRLIDFLYLSHAVLCCKDEADVNASGGDPDISDITRLIDFLYLSHSPLASCP